MATNSTDSSAMPTIDGFVSRVRSLKKTLATAPTPDGMGRITMGVHPVDGVALAVSVSMDLAPDQLMKLAGDLVLLASQVRAASATVEA